MKKKKSKSKTWWKSQDVKLLNQWERDVKREAKLAIENGRIRIGDILVP